MSGGDFLCIDAGVLCPSFCFRKIVIDSLLIEMTSVSFFILSGYQCRKVISSSREQKTWWYSIEMFLYSRYDSCFF